MCVCVCVPSIISGPLLFHEVAKSDLGFLKVSDALQVISCAAPS